jgi:hypothetical protein
VATKLFLLLLKPKLLFTKLGSKPDSSKASSVWEIVDITQSGISGVP